MFNELMNPAVPVNVSLLEKAIISSYSSGVQEAIYAINFVYERSDATNIFDQLILPEKSPYVKVFGMQMFNKFVECQWCNLATENRTSLKNMLLGFIENSVASLKEKRVPINEQVLNLADKVLISILKYEWPNEWNDFRNFVLNSVETSNELFCNYLQVYGLLAQDIASSYTDFTSTLHSPPRSGELFGALTNDFPMLASVMENILLTSENQNVINSILMNLKYFIKTLELTVIFNTNLMNIICDKFLQNNLYTPLCLSVFGEVANAGQFFEGADFVVPVFVSIVNGLIPVFNSNNLSDACKYYNITSNEFIHIFTTSMTYYISAFYKYLEQSENEYVLALQWLFTITKEGETEDFRQCIELWFTLARHIYSEHVSNQINYEPFYVPLLSSLRRLAISKMEAPNEIMISIDENGIAQPKKKKVTTVASVAYTTMREMLVYLTHIDKNDMLKALIEKINEIKNSNDIDQNSINSLCWAIGSLSGVLPDEEEQGFITHVLEYLISLCRETADINMRAIIACGIMYICSQFGRLLAKHWELLKAILLKLFEFMREQNPAVQDSAVDSLKTVCKHCRSEIIKKQMNEETSFLEQMVSNIQDIFAPLSLDNIIEALESLVVLIQCVGDQQRKDYTVKVCAELNSKLEYLCSNPQLVNLEWHEQFLFILKCNTKLAKFLGNVYIENQFVIIFPKLIEIYNRAISGINYCLNNNKIVSQEASMIKTIKSAIARLITESISGCGQSNLIQKIILQPVVDIFFQDYRMSQCKTPEVIGLVASIVSRVPDYASTKIDSIFISIIEPTIQLLQDPNDNQQFKVEFNQLTSSLCNSCTSFLTTIPKEKIDLFINCLKLQCENFDLSISEKAIQVLYDLVNIIESRVPHQFLIDFQTYYYSEFLTFVFILLTDSIHKFAFNTLIALSRKLVSSQSINTNIEELVGNFSEIFLNRSPMEIFEFITQLIKSSSNYSEFKSLVRVFLVESRKYSPKDLSMFQLELEEVKKIIEEKKKIPGLIPPTQDPDVLKDINNLTNFISNFVFKP